MSMQPIILSSPNRDDRPENAAIDALILHYTGMQSGEEAIERLCDREAKVSAHYVVEEDGRIFQLVPEEDRAWHAGVSSWRGRERMNDVSIGIEIVNPGHEFGYRAFPEAQMQAVAKLCREIVLRHRIPARNVIGHSDVAPSRKEDPGELFDWAGLAKQGVGLWPEVNSAPFKHILTEGDSGLEISELQARLRSYGYALAEEGYFGPETKKVVIAFQRHFRPENIDGDWDGESEVRLQKLLQNLA